MIPRRMVIVSLLLACFVGSLQAQPKILEETFDLGSSDPPSGWTNEVISGWIWIDEQYSPYSFCWVEDYSSNCGWIRADCKPDETGMQGIRGRAWSTTWEEEEGEAKLTTRSIDCSGWDFVYFRFEHSYYFFESAPGDVGESEAWGKLKVITPGETKEIDSWRDMSSSNEWQWTNNYNITPWAAYESNVKIQWHVYVYADDGTPYVDEERGIARWYIDNVKVFAECGYCDAKIRDPQDLTWVGDGWYFDDGLNQTVTGYVDPGSTIIYLIALEAKQPNFSARFNVTGPGSSGDWAVKYFDAVTGGNDITSQVTGSGWKTERLLPTWEKIIRMEVTPNSGIDIHETLELLVQSSSMNGEHVDGVKAICIIAEHKPDGWIKEGTWWEDPYVGDDIYNIDGTDQTVEVIALWSTFQYTVQAQNDSWNTPERLVVTGTPSGSVNGVSYSVSYFSAHGGDEITSQVTGSGFTTSLLDPGDRYGIWIDVIPEEKARYTLPLATYDVFVTIRPEGYSEPLDVVKASTSPIVTYPDNQIAVAGGAYLGNDVYNLDGTDQTATASVDPGETAVYYIKMENDSPNYWNEYFWPFGTGSGSAGGADFDVKYYDALSGGNDMTEKYTLDCGMIQVGPIDPGAYRDVRLEVTPQVSPDPPPGTTYDILFKLRDSQTCCTCDPQDVVKASTSIREHKPDNLIAKEGEFYIGNGIYNTDGTDQSAACMVVYNEAAVYHIKIENDSQNATESFTVTGTGDGTSGGGTFEVRYYDALSGGNDITTQVTGSGWTTATLDIAGSTEMRAEVTPVGTVLPYFEWEILIRSMSSGYGNKEDVVKASTSVGEHKPDNLIAKAGESYVGNGIYNTDGTDQSAACTVVCNETAVYHIKIENDSQIAAESFTVTGTGDGTSGGGTFEVRYYDALSGGNDITTQVTGSGWTTANLDIAGSTEMRAEVTPGGTVLPYSEWEILIHSMSSGYGNKEDVVLARTVLEEYDCDGVRDSDDNCPNDPNSDQANSDGDSHGDVCDNCQNSDNEDQADGDEDGVGDVCDNCPDNANPGQEDTDGDGFGNACDNAPTVPNTDQADEDADGFGDACDIDMIGLHYRAQLRGPQGLLRGADDGALDFPYFDFGWHCVGETGCGELTITNGSEMDVIIAQVCAQCTVVAGSECGFFYIEQPAPRNMVLHLGESVIIGFCYDPYQEPPAQGFRWDRCFDAAIYYQIPGDPRYQTLGVYFEGKRAEDGCFLGRLADEQDFGTVRVGFSGEQIIQLWNTGCRPLTVEAITSSVPEFTVPSPAFPLTVAEHSARDVVVRFDPPGVGEVEGVLTVVTNAQNRNVETGELIGDVEIAVRGVGIEAVLGDVTGDGELNVLDLLQLINIVLGTLEPTAQQVWTADMDGNGVVNILDAIALVNVILTE